MAAAAARITFPRDPTRPQTMVGPSIPPPQATLTRLLGDRIVTVVSCLAAATLRGMKLAVRQEAKAERELHEAVEAAKGAK